MPYWENNVSSSNENVKISYYKYTSLDGKSQLLAFVVNTSKKMVNVTVGFEENCALATDMMENAECGFTFDLPPYGNKILFVR